MELMPVCITYTDEFHSLVNHCCSTLKHNNIIIHLNNTSTQEKYSGFRSNGWFECLKNKMIFFRKILDKIEYNEVAASIDCDIQFFKVDEFYNLKKQLESSSFLCFAQTENWTTMSGMNGGFLLFKKHDLVIKFIDTIISQDYTTQFLGDQEFINKFIVEFKIPYLLLDSYKYMHGGPIVNKTLNYPDINNIVMHHATWTNNLKSKQEQINYVRNLCKLKIVDWNRVTLDNNNVSHYDNGNYLFSEFS